MDAQAAYDAAPYASKPFPEAHPDRLNVVGRLLGLDPPPVEGARVLELGCASGGNLWPIALRLPATRCVGVDISGVQLDEGRALVEGLGLTNCELVQADIRDLDGSLGTFDYIVAHGVWSWVPPAVQDAVLRVVRACLAPRGLATISYNTYPGWFRRGMVREMCRWHVGEIEDPEERVDQARALVAFMLEALDDSTSHHAEAIRREARLLRETDRTYLLHGLLAPINAPCWYHEMHARVQSSGLAIVGDAVLRNVLHDDLPAGAQAKLAALPAGSVRREQLADLLGNGTFRRSLIAHDPVPPALRSEVVLDLHASTLASPAPPPDGQRTPTFSLFRGRSFSVREPLMAALMQVLVEARPATIPVRELIARARRVSGIGDAPGQDGVLARTLVTLFSRGALRLFPRDLGIASTAGPRPRACPAIRLCASRDQGVPSLRHEHCVLRTMARQLVQLLDGQTDRAALVDRLVALHRAGRLTVQEDGGSVLGEGAFHAACRQGIDEWLDGMAGAGFLVD